MAVMTMGASAGAGEAVAPSVAGGTGYQVRGGQIMPPWALGALAQVMTTIERLVVLILGARAPRQVLQSVIGGDVIQVSSLPTLGGFPRERFQDQLMHEAGHRLAATRKSDAVVSSPIQVEPADAPLADDTFRCIAMSNIASEGADAPVATRLVQPFPAGDGLPDFFHVKSPLNHLAVTNP